MAGRKHTRIREEEERNVGIAIERRKEEKIERMGEKRRKAEDKNHVN